MSDVPAEEEENPVAQHKAPATKDARKQPRATDEELDDGRHMFGIGCLLLADAGSFQGALFCIRTLSDPSDKTRARNGFRQRRA
jgi:hypothetical protein